MVGAEPGNDSCKRRFNPHAAALSPKRVPQRKFSGLTVNGLRVYICPVTTFKKLRESAGLTQAQVAELLGVTIRSLTRWETGVLPTPKMATLALLYIVEKQKKGTR